MKSRAALLLLCVLGVLASEQAVAGAANPVPGDRYIAVDPEVGRTVLRVGRDGRTITQWSGGSFSDVVLNKFARCRDPQGVWPQMIASVSLAGQRVDRHGRLRAVGRVPIPAGIFLAGIDRMEVLLNGHFVRSPRYASEGSPRAFRGTIRARLPNPGGIACTSGPFPLVAFLVPDPPFRGCRSQPARTLLRTASTRIFVQRGRTDWVSKERLVYGCRYDVGQRALLTTLPDRVHTFDKLRLAGHYVAYAVRYCPSMTRCVAGWIGRADLLRGHVDDDLSSTAFPATGSIPRTIGSLVLKRNGSLAYGYEGEVVPTGGPLQSDIVAIDRDGVHLLDRGSDVDPNSLTLEGSLLRWRRGGQTKTALLN